MTQGENLSASSISGLKSNAVNETVNSMYFKYNWGIASGLQNYWLSSIGTSNWSGNQNYVSYVGWGGGITR